MNKRAKRGSVKGYKEYIDSLTQAMQCCSNDGSSYVSGQLIMLPFCPLLFHLILLIFM